MLVKAGFYVVFKIKESSPLYRGGNIVGLLDLFFELRQSCDEGAQGVVGKLGIGVVGYIQNGKVFFDLFLELGFGFTDFFSVAEYLLFVGKEIVSEREAGEVGM